VLIKIAAKAWKAPGFVLSAPYPRCTLPPTDVLVIYGIVRKTKVVGASAVVPMVAATHNPCQQKQNKKIN